MYFFGIQKKNNKKTQPCQTECYFGNICFRMKKSTTALPKQKQNQKTKNVWRKKKKKTTIIEKKNTANMLWKWKKWKVVFVSKNWKIYGNEIFPLQNTGQARTPF